ncbi:MAG: OadG family protein [Gammaproteobacteria bacterium]|nr:OadG family protein [Gammaproteobacteria bacterium]
MQATLIDQGINLMLYGMGTVFVFLTILVFATLLMSRVVSRLQRDGVPEAEAAADVTTNINRQPSAQIMAAIELAIAQHRKKNQH